MYYVNKIVGFATNPFSVGIALIVLGLVAWKWRKVAYASFVLALAWLWVWSMPAMCRWTGWALEGPWLTSEGQEPTAESFPTADVIVLLSGGMCANTNITDQGELCMGADRPRFAAQLYRAGKAPRIVLTGLESRQSTVPFLRDLGVPESAMLVDNDSMNTEENAKMVWKVISDQRLAVSNQLLAVSGQQLVDSTNHQSLTTNSQPLTTNHQQLTANSSRPKALLVTSAFHMRRSVLMFQKYAPELEIIPAPSDFEVLATCQESIKLKDFLPSDGALTRNAIHIKEFVGYYGYRFLRRYKR